MTKTLTFAAAAAALLAGTSAFAQTATSTTSTTTAPAADAALAATTSASTQTTGDGAATQTTVAATAPTTKVVSQEGGTTKETVATEPIVTDGAVKTATTIRTADGQDLVKTTVNTDGTASTAVAGDVPVKRTVKYVGNKKIEKTKATVTTDAPVNVQTATTTSDGQAVAVSTTASPNGDAAAVEPPAAAAVAAVATDAVPPPASDAAVAAAPVQTASVDQVSAAQSSLAGFDANKDGSLSPLEFGQMVLASSAPASGGTAAVPNNQRYSKREHNPATTVLNQTGGVFSKADTNGDHMISADELATWQASGSPQ